MPEKSSYGEPLLHPNFTGYNDLSLLICNLLRPSSYIFLGFSFTVILLLSPLCIFILYMGLKRWQKCSTTMSGISSHSDCFTYHLATMELIGITGYIICCCSVFTLQNQTFLIGYFLSTVPWYGGLFFHVLTCVERYLAVVHPIIYASLRNERGIKVRNICIGCVWLLTTVVTGLITFENISAVIDISLITLCVIVILFCSISVLRVLMRPGPAVQAGAGDKKRVDPSKRKAFFAIVAILGVLVLRCAWVVTLASVLISGPNQCVIMVSGFMFELPSYFVLPLLFLRRAGVLVCCRKTPQEHKTAAAQGSTLDLQK